MSKLLKMAPETLTDLLGLSSKGLKITASTVQEDGVLEFTVEGDGLQAITEDHITLQYGSVSNENHDRGHILRSVVGIDFKAAE